MPVALVALSHSPLIGLNDPAQEVLDEVDHAIAGARKFVQEYDPELVVLFAPDHYNGSSTARCHPSRSRRVRSQSETSDPPRGRSWSTTRRRTRSPRASLERDIDLTISARMVVDHGFVQPLEMLFGGIQSVPTVPVFVNGVAARSARCAGSGSSARRSARRPRGSTRGCCSWPPAACRTIRRADPRRCTAACRRALILGNPPTPEQRARGEQRVVQSGIDLAAGTSTRKPLNPEWDNEVLDIVASGDIEQFDGWTNEFFEEQGGGSSHEVRTWIAAYAALAASGSYELQSRYYRAIPSGWPVSR